MVKYKNNKEPNFVDFIIINQNNVRIRKVAVQTPSVVAAQRTTHQKHPKMCGKLIQTNINRGPGILLGQRAKLPSGTKVPPHLEYIMAIEQVCHKLENQEVEGLRLEVIRVLNGSCPQA